MALISVPKPLRDKLGEEGSDALIDILNKTQQNQKDDIIEIVGEKFERHLSEEISGVNQRIDGVDQRIDQLRAELKEDNANLRAELKKDNANLRAELKKDNANLRAKLKEDNANLRAELKEDNANSRADIIKWMFIFWMGHVVTQFSGVLLCCSGKNRFMSVFTGLRFQS